MSNPTQKFQEQIMHFTNLYPQFKAYFYGFKDAEPVERQGEALKLRRHRRITQLQNNGMSFGQAHLQALEEQLEEAEAQLAQVEQDVADREEEIEFEHAQREKAEAQLAQVERERDDYRSVNESVRVCADLTHHRELVEPLGDCVVCALSAALVREKGLREALEEIEEVARFDKGHPDFDRIRDVADRALADQGASE